MGTTWFTSVFRSLSLVSILLLLHSQSVLAGSHLLNKNAQLSFGQQTVGASVTQTVDLTRTTYKEIPAGSGIHRIETTHTVTGISISGANSSEFAISNDTCVGVRFVRGTTDTCTFDVTFNPATEGGKSAQIDIATDVPRQNRDIDLIATAGTLDAATDPQAVSLMQSQVELNRRMTRAQVSMISRRLEALHGQPDARQATQDALRSRKPSRLAPSSRLLEPGRAEAVEPDHPDTVGSGSPLLQQLVAAASTNRLAFAYSSARSSGSANDWLPANTGAWVSGNVEFGNREADGIFNDMEFGSDELALGVDVLVAPDFVAGASVGYSVGEAVSGSGATVNEADGFSLSLYGSYSPTRDLFLDALLGYGAFEHEMRRRIFGSTAIAGRDASQWFGALSTGYEYVKPGLLLSPYARYEFSHDQFDAATESGAGANNLVYDEHTVDNQKLSLGLRVATLRKMMSGWAKTRLRFEYGHDFTNQDKPSAHYAATPGTSYQLPVADLDRDSLLFGIGNDYVLGGGLQLSLDYEVTRYSGSDYDQQFGIWLSQSLEGRSDISGSEGRVPSSVFGIPVKLQVEYLNDDNVNRVGNQSPMLADDIYIVRAGTTQRMPAGERGVFSITGELETEHHHRYARLSRNSAGLSGGYQHRFGEGFNAIHVGGRAYASYDSVDSDLRSGYRYGAGINASQAITETLDWFVELSQNHRNAQSNVFDLAHSSLLVDIGYSLGRWGTLYANGEYRVGETVSSSLGAAYPGIESVVDDAFPATHYAYKYDARTTLFKLGYNLPLGAQDSIDISWRRIEADPDLAPAAGYYDGSNYVIHQVGAEYRMQFD